MFKGFKEFLLRGNVVDLAVAVIIGAAFGAVVDSMVKGIIDPLLAGLIGKPNFDDVAAIAIGDAKVKPGMVITGLVNFVLKASVIYFAIVLPMKKILERNKQEAAAAPPGPSTQEVLLTEIRDLLKNRA